LLPFAVEAGAATCELALPSPDARKQAVGCGAVGFVISAKLFEHHPFLGSDSKREVDDEITQRRRERRGQSTICASAVIAYFAAAINFTELKFILGDTFRMLYDGFLNSDLCAKGVVQIGERENKNWGPPHFGPRK
jgi:hypothetical protein